MWDRAFTTWSDVSSSMMPLLMKHEGQPLIQPIVFTLIVALPIKMLKSTRLFFCVHFLIPRKACQQDIMNVLSKLCTCDLWTCDKALLWTSFKDKDIIYCVCIVKYNTEWQTSRVCLQRKTSSAALVFIYIWWCKYMKYCVSIGSSLQAVKYQGDDGSGWNTLLCWHWCVLKNKWRHYSIIYMCHCSLSDRARRGVQFADIHRLAGPGL